MDLLSSIFAMFSFGMCGLPWLLTILALIDALRNEAEWYWIPIVLLVPILGPAIYFVVTRSSLVGGASAAGADRAQRRWARRRLREIQVQLDHWRGSALLVEAGEALLLLGKNREAEGYLREAAANGAPVEIVNFPLASALQYQWRFDEALPLLEAVHEYDPRFKFGEAALALARCLDESGNKDAAEKQLRSILEDHNFVEARVRLARILVTRGDREEANRLLEQVASDAACLPKNLMRRQRPWIRAARGLRSGTASLPKPAPTRRGGTPKWVWVAAIFVALIPLGLVAYSMIMMSTMGMWGEAVTDSYLKSEELAAELIELDDRFPPRSLSELEASELTVDEVATYLTVRRELSPHIAVYSQARDEVRQFYENMDDERLPFFGVRRGVKLNQEFVQAQIACRQAALDALRNRQVGPGTLVQVLDVVEWRWLRRREALPFALEPHDRGLLYESRTQLGYYEDTSWTSDEDPYRRRWELEKSNLEARVESLEQRAEEHSGLSGATVELLESRRAELEAFDPEELEALLFITDAIQLPY
jgi:hypothetical protein